MLSRLFTSTDPWDDVLALARDRGILPTTLSSAEGRRIFREAAQERAVFSARTTSAAYLQELRDRLERIVQGGYDNDLPQLRLELKNLLQELGYDPATGFPGDASLGVPAAAPGSLQDLSSTRRLNLILQTQERLLRGSAQKARGLDRIAQFPAWELVRIGTRRIPRGEMGTKSWGRRWLEAGGPAPVIDGATGTPRLMALKSDPIWAGIGDSTRFEDALGVDHPPFAFNSGMGWREIPAREWARLTEAGQVRAATPATTAVARTEARDAETSIPKTELPKGLSPELLQRLRGIATPAYRDEVERRLRAA